MAESVPWLDLEQQKAWRSYLIGSALLSEHLNDDLAQAGLTLAEYEVMVRLSEAPNWQLRMSALADSLVHSRSRLTHTVARMERRGLVLRTPSPGDGRGVDCLLTDIGYELLKEAAPSHVLAVRRILVDVLTEDELKLVGKVFAKIAERAADIKGVAIDFPFPGGNSEHDSGAP